MSKPNNAPCLKIVMMGETEAEVLIYGTIDTYGVNAKDFYDQLRALKGVKTLTVRINSDGGSIFEGLAIYTLLMDTKAKVVVMIDGIALSMASVIAMAGVEIVMAQNAMMMIHNPATGAYGEAKDMQHTADLLDRLKAQLVDIYAKRTGQSPETIAQFMDSEKWLFADEALELGFADRITDDRAVAASFDPGRYRNVPDNLRNQPINLEGVISMTKSNEAAGAATVPPPLPTAKGTESAALDAQDTLKSFRAQQAAETARVADIRALCGGKFAEIEAKAITEGWDKDRAELEILRASRATGPAIHAGHAPLSAEVLEAAIRLGTSERQSAVEKGYKPEVLDRAFKMRRIGLRGLIDECCRLDGRQVLPSYASEKEVIRNAFSTSSLPGILGNAMNKTLLDAYAAVPSVAKQIAKKLNANDFKTHTGYRLTGDSVMKEVGEGGELQHGTLGEQSFTYSVDTFGRIFGITRQMMVNDDLGALMGIPQMLGRGAALAIEKAFWTLVLANTGTFFGSGNENYFEGASTPLGIDSLGDAVQLFSDQVDADGEPIAAVPKFLVVPTALEALAWELFKATGIVLTETTTAVRGNANIYAGRFQPLPTPYLNNSSYTGYSATAWYLFGDPNDVAAFGIAYLNGIEQPTIEETDQAPDVLGTGWRGYIDFGVCQLDPRGAVKSKGAA